MGVYFQGNESIQNIPEKVQNLTTNLTKGKHPLQVFQCITFLIIPCNHSCKSTYTVLHFMIASGHEGNIISLKQTVGCLSADRHVGMCPEWITFTVI